MDINFNETFTILRKKIELGEIGGGQEQRQAKNNSLNSTASMAYEDQVVFLLHASLSDKLRTYCFLFIYCQGCNLRH